MFIISIILHEKASLISTATVARKEKFSIIFKENVSDFMLWFRASLICINNCPTRCNTKQSIYYSASSLYVFRVSITPIIRTTQNFKYSFQYWSYFLFSYLPPTWSSLATLEVGNRTVPEALVTVLCTPDNGCDWNTKPVKWSLATLEGVSCIKNMISTGGYSYSFVYSWWWVWLTPETCTVKFGHVGGR